MAFLQTRDPELHALISSIQEQELAHLREAENSQPSKGLVRALFLPVISSLTNIMIWLSIWGDSSWMRAEIARHKKA